MNSPSPEVATLAVRRVRRGLEEQFAQFLPELLTAARSAPGHRFATVVRMPDGSGSLFLVFFQFGTQADLSAWLSSSYLQRWRSRADACSEATSFLSTNAADPWFRLPASPRPIPWRAWALSLLGVYPTIALALWATAPVFSTWPFLLRTLALSALVTAAMTYFVMPAILRRLGDWAYGQPGSPAIVLEQRSSAPEAND